MGAMGSQITSLTIVFSTVNSSADQSKHQSSASLALGKSAGTGGFPAKMASNAENVSISWRQHENSKKYISLPVHNISALLYEWDILSAIKVIQGFLTSISERVYDFMTEIYCVDSCSIVHLSWQLSRYYMRKIMTWSYGDLLRKSNIIVYTFVKWFLTTLGFRTNKMGSLCEIVTMVSRPMTIDTHKLW